MITISVLGLDQYVVGQYSQENTTSLANLYETSEDNINFYAPNCYVFHKGVEQTSWNTIVRIHAPKQFEIFEAKIAKYILGTLNEFTINITLEFFYYDKKNSYTYLNKEYPHFITESNEVSVENEHECHCGHHHDEECDCDGECDCDCEDGCDCEHENEEIYMGNMFEGFEEKLEEAKKNK